MDLLEEIGNHLDRIKQVKCVENVVLSQISGNPIQSAGVWFSRDEIFNVSSATNAIFHAGIKVHPNNLKYILIEGKKAKFVIAPLNVSISGHQSINKLFIATTVQPNTNLRELYPRIDDCLGLIKRVMVRSGESFERPRFQFNVQRIQSIIQGFNVKENEDFNFKVSSFSLNLTEGTSIELKKVLNRVSVALPDLQFAYIVLGGGYVASKILKRTEIEEEDVDAISAKTYSLFQTANRCAWLLKKTNVESVLLNGEDKFQFIHSLGSLGKAIFCAEIRKSRQNLGLLRLTITQFTTKIHNILQEDFENQI